MLKYALVPTFFSVYLDLNDYNNLEHLFQFSSAGCGGRSFGRAVDPLQGVASKRSRESEHGAALKALCFAPSTDAFRFPLCSVLGSAPRLRGPSRTTPCCVASSWPPKMNAWRPT